jgi:hypothetical protein
MSKRNLLIDEYPLLVLPSLATLIGLNEAIALQQVHYWLENPKGGIEIDGVRWVYNTYEEWQRDNFPFWSVRTVQRTFVHLEEIQLVIAKQQAAYDRKKYYRVHYAKLASWNEPDWHNADLQNGMMEDAKMARSLKESETTTEITQIKKNWETILLQLKPDRRSGSFEKNTAGTQVLRFDGNGLVVACADDSARAWLEDNLKTAAEKTLIGILQQEVSVQFVVSGGVPA